MLGYWKNSGSRRSEAASCSRRSFIPRALKQHSTSPGTAQTEQGVCKLCPGGTRKRPSHDPDDDHSPVMLQTRSDMNFL